MSARASSRDSGLHVSLPEHDVPLDDFELPDQSAVVDRPVGDTGVMGVAHEVVHPIDVQFPGDEPAELPLASHQRRDAVRVQPVLVEHVRDGAVRKQVANIGVGDSRGPLEQSLDVVTVGRVADIVQKGRGTDVFSPIPTDVEVLECPAREVIHAEAVFEPRVVR